MICCTLLYYVILCYTMLYYVVLMQVKCLTLFVTHYPLLAEIADTYPNNVTNYHMSFLLNDKHHQTGKITNISLYNNLTKDTSMGCFTNPTPRQHSTTVHGFKKRSLFTSALIGYPLKSTNKCQFI